MGYDLSRLVFVTSATGYNLALLSELSRHLE